MLNSSLLHLNIYETKQYYFTYKAMKPQLEVTFAVVDLLAVKLVVTP